MITCQACGSKDVAQRMGKNGRYYLVDTKRPHFCPKRPKNGAKPIARSAKPGPAVNPMLAEVVGWLQGPAHKMRKDEAARFVAAAWPAEDADALYLAALGLINAEMLAKQRR